MLPEKRFPINFGATIGGFAGDSLEKTIKKIGDLGFEAIELYGYKGRYHRIIGAVRPGCWFHELGKSDFKKMRKWLKRFKRVSIHTSTAAFGTPLFTINKRIQKEVIWQFKKIIAAAGELEAGIVNSHCDPKDEYPLEMYWQEMLDVYGDLGNCARRHGIRFTIETLFPPTLQTYKQLIEEIDHPCVGSCLDFGHIIKCGEDVPAKLRGTQEGEKLANEIARRHIAALGNKVWHIHLHDVRRLPNGS
ncbi:MAG: TIM barrel protein, partial [Kiritimatiellaeota bacterium]|nr:TIM barrel protein [Kiritimatiellota bacterium]